MRAPNRSHREGESVDTMLHAGARVLLSRVRSSGDLSRIKIKRIHLLEHRIWANAICAHCTGALPPIFSGGMSRERGKEGVASSTTTTRIPIPKPNQSVAHSGPLWNNLVVRAHFVCFSFPRRARLRMNWLTLFSLYYRNSAGVHKSTGKRTPLSLRQRQ